MNFYTNNTNNTNNPLFLLPTIVISIRPFYDICIVWLYWQVGITSEHSN